MQATIKRNNFLKALNHIQSVVERRNTIPILSNVMLVVEDNHISLTATDLDIEIREKIEAEIERKGAFTVSAHMMYDIVRKLPEDALVKLILNGENQQVQLVSGQSSFVLNSLPREDFPVLPADNMQHAFLLPVDDLRNLFAKTSFAISTEETRYYLNGVFFHIVDCDGVSVLRSVATDGHRLAQCQSACPVGGEEMPSIIIPRKTVNELQKLLEDIQGDISVQVSDTKIIFAFNDIVLVSKLIDGKFPDYNRVIPTDNTKILTVNPQSFSQSVQLVSSVSNEKSRAVKLILSANHLVLKVSGADGGRGDDALEVVYESEALEIGFNARYLLDIMEHLGNDKAQFAFSDSGSPVVIRDTLDAETLYVLMPMRV